MRLLELTLATPAENLALDEALLEEAEAAGEPREVLRIWESPEPFVVLGRSSRLDAEVHQEACRRAQVPILRRSSGGGVVLAGPGCLMYALVLSYQRNLGLRMIEQAHRYVLGKLANSLRPLLPDVAQRGISDLTIGGRKFSGNSLRCKRDHLLYHGTILYHFSLQQISQLLPMPARQPDYRQNRGHEDFLANLPLPLGQLRQRLIDCWPVSGDLADWPRTRTAQLVSSKYACAPWTELRR